ncbi:uncharacterized protein METZ01_LOCUS439022, partial [marine metagenome]
QGRAGARQIRYPAEVGISGATFPHSAITLVWAVDPS